MTNAKLSTDRLDALLDVIRAEYREMPGLCLTFAQVLRLWTLDPPTGRALVKRLVDAQFLRATPDGQYVRSDIRRTVDRRRELPPARFGTRLSAASHSNATG